VAKKGRARIGDSGPNFPGPGKVPHTIYQKLPDGSTIERRIWISPKQLVRLRQQILERRLNAQLDRARRDIEQRAIRLRAMAEKPR
jgi:hypothetical protein